MGRGTRRWAARVIGDWLSVIGVPGEAGRAAVIGYWDLFFGIFRAGGGAVEAWF